MWLPQAYPVRLHAHLARNVNDNEVCDFSLQALHTPHSLIIGPGGEQILCLSDPQQVVALALDGVPAQLAPSAITFQIRSLAAVAEGSKALAVFNELNDQARRVQIRKTPWTATSLQIRDALIALDGKRNGASYREIASIIFGHNRTTRAWTTGDLSLKDRVRRAWKRGQELSAGGYRKLLD